MIGGIRAYSTIDRRRGLLDQPALQRRVVRRPPLPPGRRSLAHLRHDADRQHDARLVLSARGLRRPHDHLAQRQLHPRRAGRRPGHLARRDCRVERVSQAAQRAGAGSGAHHDGLRPHLPGSGARAVGRRSLHDPRAIAALGIVRGREPLLPDLSDLHHRGRPVRRPRALAGARADAHRRDDPRHRRRSGDGARRGDQRVLDLDGRVRPRRDAGGLGRRGRRGLRRRVSRRRFRDPPVRLRGGHRRRHGEPQGRPDRKLDGRAARQLRQGALPRALLLHAVRAHGGDPRGAADRSVRPRVMRVAIVVAFLALLVAPPLLSSFLLALLTQAVIYAVLAMSLDIILGYTGLASLGHAAYLGLGAYSVGILATKYGASFWVTLVVGILLATAVAAIFGLVALRATGVYFLMITLALGMVVWGLANRWVSLTRGDNGISSIPRPDLGLPWSFAAALPYYYLVLVGFAVAFAVLRTIVRSPFGHTLVGIRESESH